MASSDGNMFCPAHNCRRDWASAGLGDHGYRPGSPSLPVLSAGLALLLNLAGHLLGTLAQLV
jgi:hypothetical protein